MKILVTGSAGFIGYFICKRLIERGNDVIGIDNLNDYYSTDLKQSRLDLLQNNPNYKHHYLDLVDNKKLEDVFQIHKPQRVVNMAAQAGVR